jgi:hypothetical protein
VLVLLQRLSIQGAQSTVVPAYSPWSICPRVDLHSVAWQALDEKEPVIFARVHLLADVWYQAVHVAVISDPCTEDSWFCGVLVLWFEVAVRALTIGCKIRVPVMLWASLYSQRAVLSRATCSACLLLMASP